VLNHSCDCIIFERAQWRSALDGRLARGCCVQPRSGRGQPADAVARGEGREDGLGVQLREDVRGVRARVPQHAARGCTIVHEGREVVLDRAVQRDPAAPPAGGACRPAGRATSSMVITGSGSARDARTHARRAARRRGGGADDKY
jgi:hypothetical protein